MAETPGVEEERVCSMCGHTAEPDSEFCSKECAEEFIRWFAATFPEAVKP